MYCLSYIKREREKHESLVGGIIRLIIGRRPMDQSPMTIKVRNNCTKYPLPSQFLISLHVLVAFFFKLLVSEIDFKCIWQSCLSPDKSSGTELNWVVKNEHPREGQKHDTEEDKPGIWTETIIFLCINLFWILQNIMFHKYLNLIISYALPGS